MINPIFKNNHNSMQMYNSKKDMNKHSKDKNVIDKNIKTTNFLENDIKKDVFVQKDKDEHENKDKISSSKTKITYWDYYDLLYLGM